MSSAHTGFADFTGGSVSQVPIVRGGLVAAYLTGTDGIAWSAAQIQARQAGGEGVVGIDQTPGGQMFAQDGAVEGVKASIYDVENGAGTPASAAAACRSRVALGVQQHTLYVSLDALPALQAAVAGIPGVVYGVANYAWSVTEAEAYITANPDVVYVQYGDPQTNPDTLIPGTSVTLAQANADIDVGLASWANQFIPEEESMAAVGIQNDWAVCEKCRTLVFGPEAASYPCAGGGNHVLSPTTGSYALTFTTPYPA
jgi:hypothetical protein